jgi:hypothetical protein
MTEGDRLAVAADEMHQAREVYEAAWADFLAKRAAWIRLMEETFEPQLTESRRVDRR